MKPGMSEVTEALKTLEEYCMAHPACVGCEIYDFCGDTFLVSPVQFSIGKTTQEQLPMNLSDK